MGPNKGAIARCQCILIKLWQWNTVGDTDDKGKLPRTSQSQAHSGALQFNKPYVWHQGAVTFSAGWPTSTPAFWEGVARIAWAGLPCWPFQNRTWFRPWGSQQGLCTWWVCGCQCCDTVPWVGSQRWSCGSLVPAPANITKPWVKSQSFHPQSQSAFRSHAIDLKSNWI